MTKLLLIVSALGLGMAWLADAAGGNYLGHWVGAHFGGRLASLGGSKVPDIAEYVTGRIREALWLASLVWLGCVLTGSLWPRLAKSSSRLTPWIMGILLFLALNLGCLLAAQTALFWLILRGTSVENQAQFHAKEILLREVKIRPLLALVGSSQSQAQFTEEIFNAEVKGKAWMMELHYPGSNASDVFFVGERFSPRYVSGFVYYVSFPNIYSKHPDPPTGRDLLRLRDLPASLSLGAWSHFNPVTARYTALGMFFPLFQYRASFQHALIGSAALEPKTQNAPMQSSSAIADGFGFGPEADFQKMAFRRFLENSAAKGQRVIVIVGQMNPDYEAQVSPVIRQDFQDFLRECAATHPNLTLVWQNELLVQPPDAYRDHAHVTDETAEKFTKAFARWYLAHPLSPVPSAQ